LFGFPSPPINPPAKCGNDIAPSLYSTLDGYFTLNKALSTCERVRVSDSFYHHLPLLSSKNGKKDVKLEFQKKISSSESPSQFTPHPDLRAKEEYEIDKRTKA
jgi:ATP sulfurylase